MADTNNIRTEYFEHDYDDVKILPKSNDDSDSEMAEKFGY